MMQSRHLNQISTLWSVVCQAHNEAADGNTRARHLLLERYGGAVYRYLLGAVRDADAADELSQEFAVRFLRGDFHRASRERGRFRDFLKTALVRLASRYRQQQQRLPRPVGSGIAEVVAETSPDCGLDDDFTRAWRAELLAATWQALAQLQENTRQPLYQVLCFRVEHPTMAAWEMAQHLSTLLNRPFTAAGIRQVLHRSRERFAACLIDRVRQSLPDPSLDQIEQELIDLDLLNYCKPALALLPDGSPQ